MPQRRVPRSVVPLVALGAVCSFLYPAEPYGDFTLLGRLETSNIQDAVTGFTYGKGHFWFITWHGHVLKVDRAGKLLDRFEAADLRECDGAIAYDENDDTLWIGVHHIDLEGARIGSPLKLAGLTDAILSGDIVGMNQAAEGFWLLNPWQPILYLVDRHGNALRQIPNDWFSSCGSFARVGRKAYLRSTSPSTSGSFLSASVLAVDLDSGMVTDLWEYPNPSSLILGLAEGDGFLWAAEYNPFDQVIRIEQMEIPEPKPIPAPPSESWGDFRLDRWAYSPVHPMLIEGLYGLAYDEVRRQFWIANGYEQIHQIQDEGTPVTRVLGRWNPYERRSRDLCVAGDSVWAVLDGWSGSYLDRTYTVGRLNLEGEGSVEQSWDTGFQALGGLAWDGQNFWVSGRSAAASSSVACTEIKKFDTSGALLEHFTFPDEWRYGYQDLTWHQGMLWGITGMLQEWAEIHAIDPDSGTVRQRYRTGWQNPVPNLFPTLASDGEALWTIGVAGTGGFASSHIRMLRIVPGPVPSYYPTMIEDSTYFTGIAVTNPGPEEADLSFSALGANGAPRPLPENPGRRTLPAGAQLARTGSELFGLDPSAEESSWVELRSSQPVAGLFLLVGKDLNSGDGSLAQEVPHQELVFTRVSQGPTAFQNAGARTFLHLVNLSGNALSARLHLMADGKELSSSLERLPAMGSFQGDLRSIFWAPFALDPSFQVKEAWIRVETDRPGLAGFARITLSEANTLVGLDAQPIPKGSVLYSAQLASSPEIFTSVSLVNLSGASRNVSLVAIRDDGTPMAETVTRVLEPAGSLVEDVGEVFNLPTDLLTVGSLRIEADGPAVMGDVVFGDRKSLAYAAALPLQELPLTQMLFNHVACGLGYFTGLALFNPDSADAEVTVVVRTADGGEVGRTQFSLPAGSRLARLIDELVPTAEGQVGGFVTVGSTRPIVAQQLFSRGTFLAAVPASEY